MERALPRWVWNKGIAALCDVRIPDEFASGRYAVEGRLAGLHEPRRLPDDLIADPSLPDRIRDGDLVWVRVGWLRSFVRSVLPKLQARITLVTGDSDLSVPAQVPEEARAVLDSPHVVRWYTQNHDGHSAGGRIAPLPIGLDFHTLSERSWWGEPTAEPVEQEQVLDAVRAGLPPCAERARRVYVDFGWQGAFAGSAFGSWLGRIPLFRSRGWRGRRERPIPGAQDHASRAAIVRRVRRNPLVVCQRRLLPRSETWRRMGRYAFVLSPHGNGLDCHRTWESLVLGAVVLVRRSSLDPLYAGLPVVSLDHWDEIRPERLAEWATLPERCPEASERLTSRWWVERMREGA